MCNIHVRDLSACSGMRWFWNYEERELKRPLSKETFNAAAFIWENANYAAAAIIKKFGPHADVVIDYVEDVGVCVFPYCVEKSSMPALGVIFAFPGTDGKGNLCKRAPNTAQMPLYWWAKRNPVEDKRTPQESSVLILPFTEKFNNFIDEESAAIALESDMIDKNFRRIGFKYGGHPYVSLFNSVDYYESNPKEEPKERINKIVQWMYDCNVFGFEFFGFMGAKATGDVPALLRNAADSHVLSEKEVIALDDALTTSFFFARKE